MMNDLSAMAQIKGAPGYPNIRGIVKLRAMRNGVLVTAEIHGLPHSAEKCGARVFGFHIHEGCACTGDAKDPFADAGGHFNPCGCQHPRHAGDLPPIFENNGYAWISFLTSRFTLEQVKGRTVIIHGMPDDFHTQPSGHSGMRIACGVIR